MSEKVRFPKDRTQLQNIEAFSDADLSRLHERYNRWDDIFKSWNLSGIISFGVVNALVAPFWIRNTSKDRAVRTEMFRRNTGLEVKARVIDSLKDIVGASGFHPGDPQDERAVRYVFNDEKDLSTKILPRDQRGAATERATDAVRRNRAIMAHNGAY